MKLSIAWIFEHIACNLKDIDVNDLIKKFSHITAEIESTENININLDEFTVIQVKSISDKGITGYSFELKKEFALPLRKDVEINNIYLVKKIDKNFTWVTLVDLGSAKDGLLTNIYCTDDELKGSWKDKFETKDVILTIDNKAITNRPDMWGHLGFAREFAALLGKDLISEEELFAIKSVKHYASEAPASNGSPISLEIFQESSGVNTCRRIAGLYLYDLQNRPSDLFIATRLARVDSKPIDFIVDATNYVMLDIGQPMHAFDANSIKTNKILARPAQEGQTLKLLDGEDITLDSSDYVITDGTKPLALAGIMGGFDSAVKKDSNAIYIESANFDPAVIRKSSGRLKKRTESSTRFEKSLDPNQNTSALLRFLKILNDYNLNYKSGDNISSLGSLSKEKVIIITHAEIINKIGANIGADTIELILKKLGFGILPAYEKSEIIYTITVPTYRSSKDIDLKEDIIEEVARYFGYDNIVPHLPIRAMAAFDTHYVMNMRKIKQHLAYTLFMHEAQTYAFFDEEFLKNIKYEPKDTLNLANPLSQVYKRLVTSLVPNLLKCVDSNFHKNESLRFFEINRVWFMNHEMPIETQAISGIFFESKKDLDFYTCKNLLNSLFNLLSLEVSWIKPKSEIESWYNKNQVADIMYNSRVIGRAGKASSLFLNQITEGQAFIFELDANFLINYRVPEVKFVPLAKYPEVELDISILIPIEIVSLKIEEIIKKSDPRIIDVSLLDFYHKDEWGSNKSMTFRFKIYDDKKTMAKEEIEQVNQLVINSLKTLGAQIR